MRLFVAFEISGDVRRVLGDLIARLQPLARHARWVRPQAIHLTLKFIGEVPDASAIAPIRAALAPLRSPQPVELRFRALGFFPHEGQPRVLWCGVDASSNLPALAAAIEEALAPLGFPRDDRAFVPHLTLARFPSPDHLAALVDCASELRSHDFGAVRESSFHLFQSFLKPSGAEYTKLATFDFVPPSASLGAGSLKGPA
jgi:RNA 2',3'-cyclic 3'-phosphodiesterase